MYYSSLHHKYLSPIRLLGAKKVRGTGHLSAWRGHKKHTEKVPAWKTYAHMEYYQICLQETERDSVERIHLARIRDRWRATVNEVMGHQAKQYSQNVDQLRNYYLLKDSAPWRWFLCGFESSASNSRMIGTMNWKECGSHGLIWGSTQPSA